MFLAIPLQTPTLISFEEKHWIRKVGSSFSHNWCKNLKKVNPEKFSYVEFIVTWRMFCSPLLIKRRHVMNLWAFADEQFCEEKRLTKRIGFHTIWKLKLIMNDYQHWVKNILARLIQNLEKTIGICTNNYYKIVLVEILPMTVK